MKIRHDQQCTCEHCAQHYELICTETPRTPNNRYQYRGELIHTKYCTCGECVPSAIKEDSLWYSVFQPSAKQKAGLEADLCAAMRDARRIELDVLKEGIAIYEGRIPTEEEISMHCGINAYMHPGNICGEVFWRGQKIGYIESGYDSIKSWWKQEQEFERPKYWAKFTPGLPKEGYDFQIKAGSVMQFPRFPIVTPEDFNRSIEAFLETAMPFYGLARETGKRESGRRETEWLGEEYRKLEELLQKDMVKFGQMIYRPITILPDKTAGIYTMMKNAEQKPEGTEVEWNCYLNQFRLQKKCESVCEVCDKVKMPVSNREEFNEALAKLEERGFTGPVDLTCEENNTFEQTQEYHGEESNNQDRCAQAKGGIKKFRIIADFNAEQYEELRRTGKITLTEEQQSGEWLTGNEEVSEQDAKTGNHADECHCKECNEAFRHKIIGEFKPHPKGCQCTSCKLVARIYTTAERICRSESDEAFARYQQQSKRIE